MRRILFLLLMFASFVLAGAVAGVAAWLTNP